jgi:hypothetical protein
MNVEDIAVDLIDVTERRRADFGDLDGLAEGIRRVGLLAPILVDRNGSGRYRLIFGERRLRAVRLLGHGTIAAQLREHMTDDEFRAIELEENDNRKALTEGERARTFKSSQTLLERAKQAVERHENNSGGVPELKRGPKPKAGVSRDEIAADLGVSEKAFRRAEQHVETVEHWPFMRDWRQSQVLAVREAFERVPTEDAQQKIVAILACARMMDPALAVELIGKLSKKSAKERDEIYRLSQSEDDRDRSRALSLSKELPPMPDPRWLPLKQMLSDIRHMIRRYPLDPLNGRLEAVSAELKSISEVLGTSRPE